MQILSKEELLSDPNKWATKLKCSVFIYPTDTIYGIGCDATNDLLVKKIRKLKQRPNAPFSVISPSIDWITKNCIIPEAAIEWLDKLPGPFTFIFKLKEPMAISNLINPGFKTIGIRIPDNWFTKFIQKTMVPVVTTSVNKSSENHMTTLGNCELNIRDLVDYIIYDGEKSLNPSTIVRFDKEEIEIIRR